MSYVTQNGERRTTVSVRLKSAELEQLDALRELIHAERTSRLRAAGFDWSARRVSRSDAMRWALDHSRGVL